MSEASTISVFACAFACALALARAPSCDDGDDDLAGRELMDPISRASLFPHRRDVHDPEYAPLQPATVAFENAQGAQLRGLWHECAASDDVVLVCMGNTGNATWMSPFAAILVGAGFDVLLFDYQGFGASEGVASLLSLPGDALAAWRFVTEQKGRRPEQVGVLGISLGSVLALTLAADVQPRACAVEDVFVPERQLESFLGRASSTAEQLALAGLKALVLPKIDPRANAKRFRGPLFLMHGDADWLLTPLATLELAAERPELTRTWILAATGHSPDSLQIDEWEYRDQLAGFFRDAFGRDGATLDEPRVSFEIVAGGLRAKDDEAGEGGGTEEAGIEEAGIGDGASESHGARTGAAAPIRVKALVTAPSAGPVQVSFAVPDERGLARFHHERRVVPAGESTFECELPFRPEHATIVRARRAIARGDGSWERDLSPLSRSLADFEEFREAVQRMPARVKLRREEGGPGRGATFEVALLGEEHWNEAKRRLPDASEVHPRIRPRYAELLGRIARGLEVAGIVRRRGLALEPAAAMLPFLPEDPAQFVTLGNASIDVGFESEEVELALLHLWRDRARRGDVEGAQHVWRELVKYLPDAATGAR